MPQSKTLFAALRAAQADARELPQDGRVDLGRGGYGYPLAQTVIREARRVLADHGLTFVERASTLRILRDGETSAYALECEYELYHEHSEPIPYKLSRTWAVCPSAGRPLDKSCAATSTLALSYTLRRLLLQPVGDEDALAEPERTAPPPPNETPAALRRQAIPPATVEEARRRARHDALADEIHAATVGRTAPPDPEPAPPPPAEAVAAPPAAETVTTSAALMRRYTEWAANFSRRTKGWSAEQKAEAVNGTAGAEYVTVSEEGKAIIAKERLGTDEMAALEAALPALTAPPSDDDGLPF